MARIKETIELLAKIFKDNGLSKVKAESFRLAKFDDTGVAVNMWRLMFELLYYLKFRKIDDIAIQAFSEFSEEELTVYVKTRMKQLGFRSDRFYSLPADMTCGSRDLLLALGWLMCHSRLIEVFMADCASPLDSGTSDGAVPDLPLPGDHVAHSAVSLPSMGPDWSVSDKVRYLLWFNGKLRMSLRNLHSMQRTKERLQKKISDYTRRSVKGGRGSSSHDDEMALTPLEVSMLKNPELLKKNMRLLERDNSRLESLLSWKEHEKAFWKWMESVLDAKIDSTEAGTSGGEAEGATNPLVTPRSRQVTEMVGAKLQLANALMNYQEIVDSVEAKLSTRGSAVSGEELDNILSSIECEIAIHSANLSTATAADDAGNGNRNNHNNDNPNSNNNNNRRYKDHASSQSARDRQTSTDATSVTSSTSVSESRPTSSITAGSFSETRHLFTTATGLRQPINDRAALSSSSVATTAPRSAMLPPRIAMESSLVTRGTGSVVSVATTSEMESEGGLALELENIDDELRRLQTLVGTLQSDIEYKRRREQVAESGEEVDEADGGGVRGENNEDEVLARQIEEMYRGIVKFSERH